MTNTRQNIKNLKQKGITLIALVVTIIVLLILAGVSIQMITGQNGILNKAREAADKTKAAADEEQRRLDDAVAIIDGKGFIQNSDGTIQSIDGTIQGIKIGDSINYNAQLDNKNLSYTSKEDQNGKESQVFDVSKYTKGWKVLGVENNKILIISNDIIEPSEGGLWSNGHKLYWLKGKKGHENSIEELNNICDFYGAGKYAVGGRCITAEDVNKITGYNPNCVGIRNPSKDQILTGTKCFSGNLYEYGNKIKYLWDGTEYPKYESSIGLNDKLSTGHPDYFMWYTDKWNTKNKPDNVDEIEEITTLEATAYKYYPETLKEENTSAIVGITDDNLEYNLLFNLTDPYWLATRYCFPDVTMTTYGCFWIKDGFVEFMSLAGSKGSEYDRPAGIRPVVYLDMRVKLNQNGDNNWTLSY